MLLALKTKISFYILPTPLHKAWNNEILIIDLLNDFDIEAYMPNNS